MSRLLLLLAPALLACASTTRELNVTYEGGFPFAERTTYAWDAAAQIGNPRLNDAVLTSHVRETVRRSLAEKGYTLVESGAAALVVRHIAVVQRKEGFDDESDYDVVEPLKHKDSLIGAKPIERDEEFVTYSGKLILEFVDPTRGKVVWRGAARDAVNPRGTPAARKRKTQEAVRAMLASFPPR